MKELSIEQKAKRYDEVLKGEAQIDFGKKLYKAFGQVNDFTLGMRIARYFFELGTKAEKEDVIENLWHDTSEEPNGKGYVIAWDGKYASIARYKSIVNCKWCYLSDILPNKEKGV